MRHKFDKKRTRGIRLGDDDERKRMKEKERKAFKRKKRERERERERVGGGSSIFITYLPLGSSDGREER